LCAVVFFHLCDHPCHVAFVLPDRTSSLLTLFSHGPKGTPRPREDSHPSTEVQSARITECTLPLHCQIWTFFIHYSTCCLLSAISLAKIPGLPASFFSPDDTEILISPENCRGPGSCPVKAIVPLTVTSIQFFPEEPRRLESLFCPSAGSLNTPPALLLIYTRKTFTIGRPAVLS